MKKIFIPVSIVLLMLASYAAGWWHNSRSAASLQRSRTVLYWVDPMHPSYRSDRPGKAPDCGMDLEPVYADTLASKVAAAEGQVGIDTSRQQLFGIRVTAAEKTSGAETVRWQGRVVPEDSRIYSVNAGMEGFIRETFDDSVGQFVKKDQRLATLYGPDVLAVASGYLAATAGVPGAVGKDGSRTVPLPGAVSKQGVSSIQGYTDRLLNLGLSDVQIKRMAESHQLPETIDVVAPVGGFIVARQISPGQHFERSTEFYRIADLSQVWIEAEIPARDAQRLRAGATARITIPQQHKTFTARVNSVLPQVDVATRLFKLRLECANGEFALRPGMSVDVEVPVNLPPGLIVPVDAVIDSGNAQRVYVERSTGVFEPRDVETGWQIGDRIQILKGLAEGERVVSDGTFLVDSESRLKSTARTSSDAQAPHGTSSRTGADQGMGAMPDGMKMAPAGL